MTLPCGPRLKRAQTGSVGPSREVPRPSPTQWSSRNLTNLSWYVLVAAGGECGVCLVPVSSESGPSLLGTYLLGWDAVTQSESARNSRNSMGCHHRESSSLRFGLVRYDCNVRPIESQGPDQRWCHGGFGRPQPNGHSTPCVSYTYARITVSYVHG